MRKVLEITFSGEDFRVITADNTQSALASLGENPEIFLVDSLLTGGAGEDGYTLVKELRQRCPSAAILLLTSRYAPYDAGRGQDAGADDWADKPFDTQQLIDKVRKAVLARESAGASVTSPVVFPPQVAQAPQVAQPAGGAPLRDRPPVPMAAQGLPTSASMSASSSTPNAGGPMQGGSGGFARGTLPSVGGSAPSPRTGTLMFGDSPAAPAVHTPGPMPPRPAPLAARPPPPAPPVASSAALLAAAVSAPTGQRASLPVTAPGTIGAAVTGQLARKLGELGLSQTQADAVLSLSRDVVERVVWEVVPQLAETMIKEEIQRLMRA